MSKTIALAGKGGVGKTTVAAMLVKWLIQQEKSPILAIDADPSSNLNMVLGLDLDWTVGDIREDMLSQVKSSLTKTGAAMGSLPGGISKREYLDYEVRSSLSEGDKVDLIAMGRSEGPGCYCAVNHNLREIVDKISSNYEYVVIDNEAGMEHLSRHTTHDVEHLLIISDPTLRGIVAADRIVELRNELDININNAYLIINRVPGELPDALRERIDAIDIPFLGTIPADFELSSFDLNGRPLIDLNESSPVYVSIKSMIEKIFQEK